MMNQTMPLGNLKKITGDPYSFILQAGNVEGNTNILNFISCTIKNKYVTELFN